MKWEDVPEFIVFETDPCNWVNVSYDFEEEKAERIMKRTYSHAIHPIQQELGRLSKEYDLSKLKLRDIGRLIKITHPQTVKHHLKQAIKKGLITNFTF